MKTISMWKKVGRLTPPSQKSPGKIYPSNRLYDLPPPQIGFISTFLPHKSDIN